MKTLIAAFALVALAAPTLRAEETETVTRTVAMQPGGTVDVRTFSGRVIITPTDENQVTVHAVRRGSRRQLDRVRLDVSSSGSTVRVDANHHDSSWWGDNVVESELDMLMRSHQLGDIPGLEPAAYPDVEACFAMAAR